MILEGKFVMMQVGEEFEVQLFLTLDYFEEEFEQTID